MRPFLLLLLALPLPAREPLAQRIAHTTPDQYHVAPAVHGGAGQLNYQALFDAHSLDTNLFFLHRGVIQPKSGIGAHFHNQCEEMFVIFDGEAEFTIDGRTSLLQGPAGAPCRMGHSHAIYNPTVRPIQWMNINVSALKNTYDAFDLGDSRVGAPLDKIPVFITMRLNRALLKPHGRTLYRRALDTPVFSSPWAYVDHLVLPPNSAAAPHLHREVAEFYYVVQGTGTATVAGETAAIRAGDAIPIQLAEPHSFASAPGETLEFLIVGVSRDQTRRVDLVEVKP